MYALLVIFVVFFFKQKTAYEMRISDWSSDVCSSDLLDALRGAGVRLGVSTHDDAELERALSLQPDYLALGPVYPTILKKMKWDPQGLEKVKEWKRRVGAMPLVAIGGLTGERAPGEVGRGSWRGRRWDYV